MATLPGMKTPEPNRSNCVDVNWVSHIALSQGYAASRANHIYKQHFDGVWDRVPDESLEVVMNRHVLSRLEYTTDRGEVKPVSKTQENVKAVVSAARVHCSNPELEAGPSTICVGGTVVDARTWEPVLDVRRSGCTLRLTGSFSTAEFDKFLASTFPGSDDARHAEEALAWAWLGSREGTRLEFAVLLLGPPRAGKGTFLEILQALMGHFCGLAQFGLGQFSKAGRLGTHLIVEPDFKLEGRTGWAEDFQVTTAGDKQAISRKYLPDTVNWTRPRTILAANPESIASMGDRDQAILRRMIPVTFSKSHADDADTGLKATLLSELPGIAKRLSVAWRRLRDRGFRFELPASSKTALAELARTGSGLDPLLSRFLDSAPSHVRWSLPQLWEAYRAACESDNVRNTMSRAMFNRLMRARYRCVRANGVEFAYGVQPAVVGKRPPELFGPCEQTIDGHWCETAHPWRGAFKAVESNLDQTELDI